MHTYTHKYTHACMHSITHAAAYIYPTRHNTFTQKRRESTCNRTHPHTPTHTCMHARLHAHKHTCCSIHISYAPTSTHTHTHMEREHARTYTHGILSTCTRPSCDVNICEICYCDFICLTHTYMYMFTDVHLHMYTLKYIRPCVCEHL
jgi:hypothetical protein